MPRLPDRESVGIGWSEPLGPEDYADHLPAGVSPAALLA
jgi:hypothetical protein